MYKNLTKLLIIAILTTNISYCYAFPKVKAGIKVDDVQVPTNWSVNPSSITFDNSIVKWWKLFNDEQLDNYICDLIKFNYDLHIAVSRIQEAKSLRAGAKTSLYPQVDAATKYSRYQYFAATNVATGASLDLLSAGFNSSWEIDFFGKNRWEIIAATKRIEEAENLKNAILISLISELAKNYMELRGNQALLANLKKQINIQTANLKLIESKYAIGLSPEIDVIRAKSSLESLKSRLPEIKADIKNSIYNISVLTGRDPDTLTCELLPEKPLPAVPTIISVGIPADIILKRPDVRQAQNKLAEALASAGASKADLYPSIKINGSIGLQDISLTDLANITGGLWSITPAINWKIFDRRLLKANYNASKAKVQAADGELKQTVLNALKEVESSISYLDAVKKAENKLVNATLLSENVYKKINKAYEIGLKNQIEVLDAQNTYVNNQEQLISNKTQVNIQLINLYKSLGSGWQCF